MPTSRSLIQILLYKCEHKYRQNTVTNTAGGCSLQTTDWREVEPRNIDDCRQRAGDQLIVVKFVNIANVWTFSSIYYRVNVKNINHMMVFLYIPCMWSCHEYFVSWEYFQYFAVFTSQTLTGLRTTLAKCTIGQFLQETNLKSNKGRI